MRAAIGLCAKQNSRFPLREARSEGAGGHMTPVLDDDDPAEQGKYGERDSPRKGTEERERETERREPDAPQRGSER